MSNITLAIKGGDGITWMTEKRPTWVDARARARHLFATFPDIELIAASRSAKPKGSAMWEFDESTKTLVESFTTGVVDDGSLRPEFLHGDHVRIHPACDAWMQGDKTGTVVTVGTKWVHVKCFWSGRVRKFFPRDLEVF